jgi:hypothetical protein
MARLLLCLSIVLVASGCRVLGIWEPECTVGDDTTCPEGVACGVGGLCGVDVAGPGQDGGVPGQDAGPPQQNIETVVTGEDGVYLLAIAPDGTLFWATSVDGGCVRRMPPARDQVASVHCEPAGTSISGLALAETDVAWVSDGPDADDHLRVKAQTSNVSAVAGTLSDALEDVGSPFDYGPSLLAARSVDGEDFYAWTQSPTDSVQGIERIIRGVTGLVTTQTRYGVFFTAGRLGGVALTDAHVFFVVESDFYARVLVRDNHARDDTGGYTAYSDSGENEGYPIGKGWVSAVYGDTMYVATRAANDAGGILSSRGAFPDSFLAVDLVIEQVDPDDPGRYARGLAADAAALYYTTGGLGSSAPGVFRLSLAAGAVPERLATLANEGGAVVVDDAYVYFTEPALTEVRRIAKP